MSAASLPSSYVCDTIPAARLASDPQPARSTAVDVSNLPVNLGAALVLDDAENITSSSKVEQDSGSPPPSEQLSPRKLCVRHQRMADEGTNLKLQQVCIFIYE
jgi:F-box/WD-40 domain protein MET30